MFCYFSTLEKYAAAKFFLCFSADFGELCLKQNYRLFCSNYKINTEYKLSICTVSSLPTLLAVTYCHDVLEKKNWIRCCVAYTKHGVNGAAEHSLGSAMKIVGSVESYITTKEIQLHW